MKREVLAEEEEWGGGRVEAGQNGGTDRRGGAVVSPAGQKLAFLNEQLKGYVPML